MGAGRVMGNVLCNERVRLEVIQPMLVSLSREPLFCCPPTLLELPILADTRMLLLRAFTMLAVRDASPKVPLLALTLPSGSEPAAAAALQCWKWILEPETVSEHLLPFSIEGRRADNHPPVPKYFRLISARLDRTHFLQYICVAQCHTFASHKCT